MKKLERRSFLTKAAAASALTAVALPSEAKPKKKIFIHHVYFWLKNPSSEADKNKLIEGLTGLSKVPTIRFHHIGTPASTNRSVIERGYSVSWMLFFDKNDIIAQYEYSAQVSKMQQEKDFYTKEIELVKKDLKELDSNLISAEKFAREKYFMKKKFLD